VCARARSANGQTNVVEELVDCGASIDVVNAVGVTALEVSVNLYARTRTHAHIHTRTDDVNIYTRTHMCTHICTHRHSHSHEQIALRNANTHTHTHNTHTHTHTHIHLLTHVNLCTYGLTCFVTLHTLTQTDGSSQCKAVCEQDSQYHTTEVSSCSKDRVHYGVHYIVNTVFTM
jgi:hypothetical protein